VFVRVSEPDSQGFFELQSVERRIDLFNSAQSIWLEHPTLGSRVDVVALDISSVVIGSQATAANEVESDAVIDNVVSQDAFILGFPFGLIANAPVPFGSEAR
jgi:hypothetical protein